MFMRPALNQFSFADLEMRQLAPMSAVLQRVSDLLDKQEKLIELVRADLERGLKKPARGRPGIAPVQVLRSLVLMRVKNWDYRELRERIDDGMSLRQFTCFDSQLVPKHDAFNRAFIKITPETVRSINEAVIQSAVALGLEDGKQLRVDTTVVETNVHYPTDATLLWDVTRALQRLMKKMRKKLPGRTPRIVNRTRSARRRMQELQRMTAQERSRQQKRKYRELIGIVEHVMADARALVKAAKKAVKKSKPSRSILDDAVIEGYCGEIESYCVLAKQVIDQARRRVLQGEQLPADEKLYSIFEPHTQLIKRGKAQKPVEFGRKVFLAESAQGLVTDYRVLEGNPADCTNVASSLEHHQEMFRYAPDRYASDRGFFSAENVKSCEDAGVNDVCIPQPGYKSQEQAERERSKAFKQGQKFRAGIEGRISVLFRGRGMKRCLARGPERFEVLVGAAVLTNNLLRIAELLADKTRRKKRPLPIAQAA